MRFFSTLFCCALAFYVNAQQVVINEVVTQPVFDYSTSNYSKTESQLGVSEIDEWVELLILEDGLNLNSWTIELLDGTDVSGDLSSSGAFQTSKYISSSDGTFANTDSGDFLVLGNVDGSGSMLNTITIRLKDNLGNLVDEVELSSDPTTAPLGNSSSALDEVVARIPDGMDTDNDAEDFIETVATPGSPNSKRGKVVINEIVTETIRDWSAADYTYKADSIGTFTAIDEWLELYILEDGLNLSKWEIQLSSTDNVVGSLSDDGAFQFSKYISNTEGSSFHETAQGDYLLLANVNGSARQLLNTGDFILENAFGEVVDQVRLGFGDAPNGNSSSKSNESVARLSNGIDTNNDSEDFSETFATPGFRNVYAKIDRYRENALVLNSDSVILNCVSDSLQNNFTISLWMKPEAPVSAQKILQIQNGNNLLKLNADQSIGSEITGVAVNSNDTVSSQNWNHVTLRKSANQFSLFLNGNLEQSWTGSFSFNNDTIILGPLSAKIEELQIWKSDLSENEIRTQMRITQSGEANDLLHYYQFNNLRPIEPLQGNNIIYKNANLVTSEAPVSDGLSTVFSVNSTGDYAMPSTVEDHFLQLSFSNNIPNGDVVVSFLEEKANNQPKGFTFNDGVWIIDNYGNNTGLSVDMLFGFPEGYLTTTDTNTYFLYKRKSNSIGEWLAYKSAADTVLLSASKRQVQFSEIESFSQFLVAATVSPLPMRFLDFYVYQKIDQLQLQWDFSKGNNFREYQILKGRHPEKLQKIAITKEPKYLDSISQNSTLYYQIEALNYSGEKTSSKIIAWSPSEENTAERINVYPNPSDERITIELEDLDEIELINSAGNQIYHKSGIEKPTISLNVSELKAGAYTLKISTTKKDVYQRIIVF